jgi:hypothetical protein
MNLMDNIQELISLQGKFRSWLELANGNFRFEPKTFHKAIEAIERVIEIAKKQEE